MFELGPACRQAGLWDFLDYVEIGLLAADTLLSLKITI